jgi:hypothetical protein
MKISTYSEEKISSKDISLVKRLTRYSIKLFSSNDAQSGVQNFNTYDLGSVDGIAGIVLNFSFYGYQ